MENIKLFLIVWAVVLVLNQVILFKATFAPYAIIAAIPHTFIISLVITYIMIKNSKKDDEEK